MPSILLVEDEAAIAELIVVNLRHNGFRTTWAMDGTGAELEIDASIPDLILLDWMLPGGSGLLLAKRWREAARTREVPIIMLTARSDEADRVAGLDAGADDYISKPFSTRELIARVRAVLRRKVPEHSGKKVSIGGLSLDPGTYRVSFRDQPLKLGPIEFRLLQFFMHSAERVHSRAQLLDKVWGDHVYIEERTIDVHVKRLREALGQAGVMIETVRGAGYRLTATPLVGIAPPEKISS
jgi:two-component system phosphate regulon response regulator PhoB